MKKVFLLIMGLCAPSLCLGQVTLEWMRATPAQRKRIEARRAAEAEEALEEALVRRLPAQEQGEGVRLGVFLPRGFQTRLWDEKTKLTLPAEPADGRGPDPQRIMLPALRAAKSWKLQMNTCAALLRETAYNYRLDFWKANGDELFVKILPIENKGPEGKPAQAEFFAKPLGGGLYGLMLRVSTVEEQPDGDTEAAEPPEKTDMQIGVLRR